MFSWLSQTLQSEYELLHCLSESNRGKVYLIRKRDGGPKLILRHYTGNADVYRSLLQIACHNLPIIYEVASQGDEHLVLEEYVKGDTLGFLLQGGLCNQEETIRIVRQLCQALWILHSMGAVHRDIKPENVILRGADAVLIDFDAARLYKPENTTDTQILGTTGYAAPEQYGLSQSDARSDIYALGVLMNVMLTGQHPSKKLAEGRLGRIIHRCIQVNPDARYKTVLHLMEVL